MKLPKGREQKLLECHKCATTHEGSSSAMELVGVKRIFERSVQSRTLRTTGYIGDGDTKTYDIISKTHPYADSIEIKTFDFVGHLQKRVGNNLRKRKIKSGSTKLADGKTPGGRGRLTLKETDRLQIYYGFAICRNIGNLDGMKNDTDTILRHRLLADDMPNHTSCPTGPESWCKYQQNPSTYTHLHPLPKAVNVHIKPV